MTRVRWGLLLPLVWAFSVWLLIMLAAGLPFVGAQTEVNPGGGGGAAGVVYIGQSSGTTNALTGNLFNNLTTGAANTAVTKTFTQATDVSWRLNSVAAYCSAGTAQLTVTDGGTTIWQTPAGAVTTTMTSFTWTTPLQLVAAAPAVTLGTCGAGNTGTLILQASKY